MSVTNLADILDLPAEQRLRLVELIWESLAATPSDLPVGDAHRAAIDAELADHHRDPDDVLTLERILSEIRRTQ
jgi:putative addiction module component (TIGR02574 family)